VNEFVFPSSLSFYSLSIMLGSPSEICRSASPFGPTPEPWSLHNVELNSTLRKPVPLRSSSIRQLSFIDRLEEMVVSCHGSRLLQEVIAKAVKDGDNRVLQDMCEKVLADPAFFVELCQDKFGNYFVQVLISAIESESICKFANILTNIESPSIADLCCHPYGSHVIQAMIRQAHDNKFVSMKLVEGLAFELLRIAPDFLGSICLVHAVKTLPTANKLLSVIAHNTVQLARSRHGHTVVIEALNRASSQTLGLIEKNLSNNLEFVLEDEFGLRVVLHSLELEKEGKVNPKYSRIKIFAERIKFDQVHFPLISYIIQNFPTHPAVESNLIPQIIDIVRNGSVPSRDQ
jgi:hypothetical protein